ncbi:MAG: hypothetical protein ACP5QO_09655 [Clostridia bacterium]
MGFGQALITLGGAVTGPAEVYVGIFWALVVGTAGAIAWQALKKGAARRDEAPVRSRDRHL